MNASQLEQLLLLEQSGELTEKQRRALAAELAANPVARQLRAELQHLATALPPGGNAPAPGAAARIAARLADARPRMAVWRPALAAAAALALLVGVRTYHGRPGPVAAGAAATVAATAEEDWTDPLDADFTELENLLLAIDSNAALDLTEL